MKRLLLVVALVLAPLSIMVGTAAADSGGVSLEQGNPWNGFQPNPASPGDSVNITVTTFQSGSQGSHATVTFTGLSAAGLTYTANGDQSAVCNQVTDTLTCTYTDYAHSAKSDNYTFQIDPNQPGGLFTIHVHVVVTGVGDAAEDVPLTVLPTSKDQCKSGGWASFGGLFKNQGDCVSFVATGGKNLPAGS